MTKFAIAFLFALLAVAPLLVAQAETQEGGERLRERFGAGARRAASRLRFFFVDGWHDILRRLGVHVREPRLDPLEAQRRLPPL